MNDDDEFNSRIKGFLLAFFVIATWSIVGFIAFFIQSLFVE